MAADFSISDESLGDPSQTWARRERTALATMRAIGYDEAVRLLESVGATGDAFGQPFSEALASARDGTFLTGEVETDAGFLIAAKIGKGIWFWRTGAGYAKGVLPTERVTTLLSLAKQKRIY